MTRSSSTRSAPAAMWALGFLLGCADSGSLATIQWKESEIDAGEVVLGQQWSGTAPWRVVGSEPIELLGVKTSCGCSKAVLEAGGARLESGRLAPGTAGLAHVGLKGDGNAGPRRETISIVWRIGTAGEPQVSALNLKVTLTEAYVVSPRAVLVTNASRKDPVPYSVEWRAVRRVDGQPTLPVLPEGLVVDNVEDGVASDGARVLRASGSVTPPKAGNQHDALLSLQIEGLTPPPPPVLIKVQYVRTVEVRPFGLVDLKEQESAPGVARGKVSVQVTSAEGPVRVAGHQVLPADLAGRARVTVKDATASCFEIELAVETGSDRFVRGLLSLELDPPALGPVEIPWLYLRKSTGLVAGGAPSGPAPKIDSTRK